ncbi:hypothetical protein [Iningainema tapete]|uniref:Lipoprotein n=1 Tax=Iningainema tapete BLCC-T55 TaxID=2748662 RepID=A0A8J6XL72_9CYAN|nr:hypothetical protein [Iningainema tapete]MBD2776798.1 hypothetical protein [Iningainema tapete BLCC-T55]
MKIFYKFLVISATIILANLVVTSCKQQCEFTTQDAQKESVQLNDSLYSRIFGSKSCSPHKLVLRLPVNINLKTQRQDQVLTSKDFTPKITTLVTFSSKYKIFDISRIDEYSNGFIYTNKDTCLAWKPSYDNKQQVLYLSMERNLQIRNPNIKSVIFLVSLPLEMKEAGVNITLERYVRDKDTSKVGAINYFNFTRQYPILKNLLRQKGKGSINTSEAFNEGKQVSNEVAREFLEISDTGGVLLERDLESMIEAKYKKTYWDSPESPACEIPKDLKQL